MRAHGVVVSCVVIAVLLLSGCTASPGSSDSSETVRATLRIIDGEASVETNGEQRVGQDGDVLHDGDVVAASGDGAIIELGWSDGALTRLGPDTSLIVGAPDALLGTRGIQRDGVSWNRIPPVAGEVSAVPYVVGIADGSPVSNRGELFMIDCRGDACRVQATGGNAGDGSRTTFRRGQIETEVIGDQLVSWEALMGDPWAQENAALDADAGFTSVSELFANADPSRGVLEGTFDVVRTGRENTCTGVMCDAIVRLQPGETRNLVYSFERQCAPGGVCTTNVNTQSIDAQTGEPRDATAPLITGAKTFTWGTDEQLAICVWTYDDGSTSATGLAANVIRWSVTPTEAEIRDGVFVVTRLEGTVESSMHIIEHTDGVTFPGCEAYEVDWATASDQVLTRRAG